MKLKAFPRRMHAARRSGFTLIEMLVVISIVVVILGVGVGATMKFREAATNRAADDQMKQLQIALNGQYETVVSQCNKDKPPDAILAYCGGDPDRTRAVHAAAMLRTYFPETFAEATASFSIQSPTDPTKVQNYNNPVRAAFKQVAGSTGLTPEQQSAVLLYLILSEQAVGQGSGEVRSKEGMVKDSGGKDYKVFIDPWNTPIRFSRWAQHADLDVAPYAHASPSGSIDPLDPKSRVVTVTSTWTAAQRDPLNVAQRNLQFVSRNRVPSVFSAGKDKTDPTDDRIGYKLNRQGASGK